MDFSESSSLAFYRFYLSKSFGSLSDFVGCRFYIVFREKYGFEVEKNTISVSKSIQISYLSNRFSKLIRNFFMERTVIIDRYSSLGLNKIPKSTWPIKCKVWQYNCTSRSFRFFFSFFQYNTYFKSSFTVFFIQLAN